ncbi:MAG TPA: hemerythrin domain-containing protein [Albitalea sp.]|nr:hemerythrin domain-containing protein [Albitalea sp.]
MARPHSPAPLPGFSTPAVGFDEPMEMLHACHERVQRSLDLLRRLCERVAEGRIDDAVFQAAQDVLRYFDIAGPHHHEDEEQHIFPAVLAQVADPVVRSAVLRLQEDHLAMEKRWARLRTPLAALAAGRGSDFGPAQIAAANRFRALYDDHIRTEETIVYPAARALFDEAALRRMGEEMGSRRGAGRAPRR